MGNINTLEQLLTYIKQKDYKPLDITEEKLISLGFDFKTLKQMDIERVWTVQNKTWFILELIDMWNWYWAICEKIKKDL